MRFQRCAPWAKISGRCCAGSALNCRRGDCVCGMEGQVQLICYLHPGWEPLIRPAEATRDWMSETPESFAYRCLPLNIANAHGWEVLSPCAFDAIWNGEAGVEAISIRLEPGAKPERAPV